MHAELNNKCNLLDWTGSEEIVAEGRISSSDPKVLVNNIPLGPNATKVRVEIAKEPGAFLWRPTAHMNSIEEAVNAEIAWPSDKVVLSMSMQSDEQDQIPSPVVR